MKLKKLLPEISLFQGDAGKNDLKDLFDDFFNKGIVPKKYKKLYYADEDEAKGISWDSGNPYRNKMLSKDAQKLKNLNQVTPEFLDYLQKYEQVGSSGNFMMIMKKDGSDMVFVLCDKSAKLITEFFAGQIKVTKGDNSYKISSKKFFKLNTYQVHWSNIAVEHKGHGIGKLMYTMVYEYVTHNLNGALLSDNILYQGSQKMWMQYIPTIASYFGIQLNGIFFPINKEEATPATMGNGDIDAMIAMETPPKDVRKIMYNVKGLSFARGEYGNIEVRDSINAKISLKPGQSIRTFTFKEDPRWMDMDEDNDIDSGRWVSKPNKKFEYTLFSNLVDEATSLPALIKQLMALDVVSRPYIVSGQGQGEFSNMKVAVFTFDNAVVIVKQSGGKLIMIPG